MSLLKKIKGWFGSRPDGGRPGQPKLYVVDGVAMLNPRGGGHVPPRDMITLLHRLGRFVEREKIEIQTVFEGEPLRKAGDGDEFSGVTVYYAAGGRGRPDEVLDLVKKGMRNRRGVTAIVQDNELEKQVLALGAHVLRCSTFRKALDNDGGGEDGYRPGGGPRRRPDRRPNDRRPQDQRPQDQRPQGQRPSPDSDGDGRNSGDAIRDLIDVVE